MEKHIRSLQEKEIYCAAFDEAEKLPFPTYIEKSDNFADEEVYDIPSDRLEEVIKSLWVFIDFPGFTKQLLDIHENAVFEVSDVKIIRYKNRNMIVSPYYFKSGGTILDFIKLDDERVFHVAFLKKM